MRRVYSIPSMDCPAEEAVIRNRLRSMQSIRAIEFDLFNRRLSVDQEGTDDSALLAALTDIGMGATLVDRSGPESAPGAHASSNTERCAAAACDASPVADASTGRWRRIAPLALGGLMATFAEGFSLWGVRDSSWPIVVLAIGSIVAGGLPTLRKGFIAVRTLTLNITVLMTVAACGCACPKKVRARRFEKRELDAQVVEAKAEVGASEDGSESTGSERASSNDAPPPPPASAPARQLRSRTPRMPKRRLPDPPSAGNVPKRINPWRERTTLPMIDAAGGGCTLLAFVEFLDDRGRVERPDKRGRIDPRAPRAVERLLAQAGISVRGAQPRSSRTADSNASRDSQAIAAAGTMLDDVESRIRDILAGATGPPPIAWRGTVVGSESASEREAERRGVRRAEPLRPLAARTGAIRA